MPHCLHVCRSIYLSVSQLSVHAACLAFSVLEMFDHPHSHGYKYSSTCMYVCVHIGYHVLRHMEVFVLHIFTYCHLCMHICVPAKVSWMPCTSHCHRQRSLDPYFSSVAYLPYSLLIHIYYAYTHMYYILYLPWICMLIFVRLLSICLYIRLFICKYIWMDMYVYA